MVVNTDPQFNLNDDDIVRVLKSIGSDQRLRLLRALSLVGAASVKALARSIGLTESLTAHHLRNLRDSGMVVADPAGQFVIYHIHPGMIALMIEFFTQLLYKENSDGRESTQTDSNNANDGADTGPAGSSSKTTNAGCDTNGVSTITGSASSRSET